MRVQIEKYRPDLSCIIDHSSKKHLYNAQLEYNKSPPGNEQDKTKSKFLKECDITHSSI